MQKEVIVAILIGLTSGLIITYGIYRARVSLTDQPQLVEQTQVTEDETTIASNLLITSPNDESIVDSEAVTIAGTTAADSFVVAIVNNSEYISTADETGNFSIEATLEDGSNIIQVIAIDEDGVQSTKELTVIFTTQPIVPLTEEASDSASVNPESAEEDAQ